METRALNVCRSGPPPEYAEDLEEDKVLIRTCKVEYEQEDRLFITRILSKSTTEDVCATSMTSQKLTAGAHCTSEAWRIPFTLPNCIRGFESVFTKEDFDILLEHR